MKNHAPDLGQDGRGGAVVEIRPKSRVQSQESGSGVGRAVAQQGCLEPQGGPKSGRGLPARRSRWHCLSGTSSLLRRHPEPQVGLAHFVHCNPWSAVVFPLLMQASLQANLCQRQFPIRVHEGCAHHCDPGGGLGRSRITPRTSGTPGAEPSIALMKNLTKTAVFAAFILFQVGSAYAASIGVSFLGDGAGGTALAPADSAGVVAQTNWNNISSTPTGNVGISDPLLDSAGNFTTVLLQFAGNDAWNADGPTDTANDRLMKGIIKQDGVGSSMTLTFTNLAAAAYDLYVYGNVNGGPVDLNVSIGATTNYWTEPAAFDDGTGFISAASSDPNIRAAGNYAKFAGVTPVSGAITLTATYQGGSDGLGIAGLQLVAAGSFPPNTITVAIAAPPQPQVVAPGGAALFSVSATGPGAGDQWFTDG